jgi:hypothetical protein
LNKKDAKETKEEKAYESNRKSWSWEGEKEIKTPKYDVLLLKTVLVLHIALVLQHLRSGSQNEGGLLSMRVIKSKSPTAADDIR